MREGIARLTQTFATVVIKRLREHTLVRTLRIRPHAREGCYAPLQSPQIGGAEWD